MLKRYPSIQSMQAFLQAARVGSFSSAARQLSLTHSAISQQIRTLEEFVGQPLFVREGGGVVLTDAGVLFANQLADGFEQIDRALSSVKERTVKQSITLDVDPELAQSWLVARLPALLGALTGTSLTVLSTPRHERSAFERVDIALRYGYGEWDGFENALICGDRLSAVGSPALLQARGLSAPLTPNAIARSAVARLHEALMDSLARGGRPASRRARSSGRIRQRRGFDRGSERRCGRRVGAWPAGGRRTAQRQSDRTHRTWKFPRTTTCTQCGRARKRSAWRRCSKRFADWSRKRSVRVSAG